MAGIFEYQGFGVLSEWNGQVSSLAAQQAMSDIAGTGANSIEITPRFWTSTINSSSVISDPAKTESDASLIQGIENAHRDGLSVVLKPNVSTLDGTATTSLQPSDVSAFFASYKAEIVHLATIAQQTGVEVFAVGNEMTTLTGAQYQSYWTDIISAVRTVYHGELTYAAATDEASKVSFWGKLDAIGVNTYPPLAVTGDAPTVANLVSAWNSVPANSYWAAAFNHQSPVDFLHSLAEQYDKPVLMTEAGYRSIDYGSSITGSWKTTGAMDLQEQADAYAAFLQVWTTEGGPWLQGVEFWQWDLSNQFSPTGFEPTGKPAQDIVAEYFKGAAPLLASGVESLTDSQIAQLAALGIKAIVATDHDVHWSLAEAAALGANGISLSEPYGTGAQTLTWNADGSLHDVHYFAITAQGYSDYDIVYDAAGKPVSETYSSGIADSWTYNADGSLHEHVETGITGRAWTTTDTIYGSGGKPSSESWLNGPTPVLTETWNADGSVQDIHHFEISGQAYTEFDVVYGANNKQAFATYSNGMAEISSYNPDNSLHIESFTGVTNQGYDTYAVGYEGLQHVVEEFGKLDGSEGVRGFIDGLTFTSSPSAETVLTSSGDSFVFQPNSNVTLTGRGANETFVFDTGFGTDTITDFLPSAESNTNHDTIAFSQATFSGFDDVMRHAFQSGSSTVIVDPAGDHLVLQHVAMAHLAATDFHFG